METIEVDAGAVNAPASEVIAFVKKMAERGVYHRTTAQLRSYALRRIVSVLGNDESTDPTALLENMDALVNRLGRANQESPATLKDYRARATKLLKDFVEYQRDPLGFQKSASESRPPKENAKKKAEKKAAKDPAETTDTPPEKSSPLFTAGGAASSTARSFPLADGRDITYVLPEPRHTAEEALRFALHLLTLAVDFDPLRPEQASMFALARTRRDTDQ
ncbi:MAG: hypothetical protein F9K40_14700 [Kofleriaceae bacterium]|nr:MAG: hypothetical protein F9K40_14700 [Kofleriaceae bacterium]